MVGKAIFVKVRKLRQVTFHLTSLTYLICQITITE